MHSIWREYVMVVTFTTGLDKSKTNIKSTAVFYNKIAPLNDWNITICVHSAIQIEGFVTNSNVDEVYNELSKLDCKHLLVQDSKGKYKSL